MHPTVIDSKVFFSSNGDMEILPPECQGFLPMRLARKLQLQESCQQKFYP